MLTPFVEEPSNYGYSTPKLSRQIDIVRVTKSLEASDCYDRFFDEVDSAGVFQRCRQSNGCPHGVMKYNKLSSLPVWQHEGAVRESVANCPIAKAHFQALATGSNPARYIQATKVDDIVDQC